MAFLCERKMGRFCVTSGQRGLIWCTLMAFVVTCVTAHSLEDIVFTFADPVLESSSFNHLVVDRNTGKVYISAVNRIYQLSPDLEVAHSIVTGPVNDSAPCNNDSRSRCVKKPKDNVNKALVIDYATSRLITCASVPQGLCSVRNLNNISHNVREVHEPVVANHATASTVAFIAPGPPNPPMTQVMYVGVTFAGNSDVPTVSSRSLGDNDLFSIVRTADTSGTRMFVNSLSRDRYPINYVYGFSSDGFSYFLTTQLRGVGSDTYYSKLVRVCHDDENYYSYTEIPMSCMGEGGGNYGYNLVQAAFVGKAGSILAEELGITAQDDVLFASFSQSETINNNTPSNISALCVYSLKAIRRKFMQNIKTCFSGIGSRGLDFISPSHACIGTKLQSISEDFCGLDLNTPLGGEQAVEAVPVAIFSQRLTAVAATATGDYTVVFAGTAQGHLKKIVVESATSAFEYGDIVVDEGSAVNKDLYFDTQSMHLYVMTERKVSKVKVQECSVYKSCLTCLGAKDPYCGWCSLSNKCSLRSDCQEAAKDPLYWISYHSGRCTTITQVTPNQLQRTTARTLDLLIENWPTPNGQFLCAFTALDRTLITNATRKPYGVNCSTPRTDTLPSIPTGQHHFTAKLSVRTTQGPDFVATNFTFFDCNTYSSCTQCVSSSFPCDWCIDGHRCTHDTAQNCQNDILVIGVSGFGPSYRSGPGFCPTINSTSDGTNEILVPCGAKKAIKVKVHVIGQFFVQTRFVCQFNIEGRVTQVNAQLRADTIYCDTVEFTYTSRAPNITASFAVIWGGSKPLDNPDNIHILIYRCNDMAFSHADPVPESSSFNHLVVDRNTGKVYISAVNRIYQLSPDLEVAHSIVTGPVNDSAPCNNDSRSRCVKKPKDNVNKALVIDYATSRLITCASVPQGLCSVRNLNNISHNVREVHEPVVASHATASTVAFIAPGPPNPPMTQVMYVGVTFAGNSDVPTVSSRSLEDNDLFSIVRTADTSGTRMFVNSLSRDRYPINYVYGFSSDGFSYFLTTQLRGVGSDTYYSKLVRVCHDDENYYSYTEIPMSCMGEGGGNYGYNLVQAAFVGKAGSILAEELGITAQDDVLFASFSQSETINNNTPSNISALCVYSLKAIRRKFMQNIKTCFSGIGSRGLDFISPSHACIGTKLQSISEDFCGLDLNTPLGGEQPVEAVPVAIFSQRLTAVAATATGDYTVVFAGTAQGHLKKIVVESATSAFEYGDIVVDEGSAVNKDLYFDTQSMHLYVLTERKVSKVKVQECSVYKSCLTCLGAKDPYCGWFSLSNKCSLRSEAAKDPLYWISYHSGRCTTITQVTPNQLQRTTARTLDLLIENWPTPNGQFLCAFTALDRTLITNATRKPYGVNCSTPRTDTLPSIPTGQHHFTAKLSVRTTQGPDFVATNFTFFDCNTYSSCTLCVSSSFPCDWCVDGHRCTHDTAQNCQNDILVTGVSRFGPSYRSGPGFCPTINSTSDGTNEILVPCGAKKAIKVKVHIIGQFIVQTRFVCQFNIEGRVTQVNAQLLADTIYCDTVEFTYTSRAPNITASFAVIWGGSKPLDNPDNIHILIYRCNDMAFSLADPVLESSSFNHLVVDRNTGKVYISAVNRIYQLSPDLEVAHSIVTGPVNDSAPCNNDSPSRCVKKPKDNVNKALVIDYATSRLITCASVPQGLCSVRNLNNISHNVREVHEPVVANHATASTVAFIAPGPPNPPMTQVMYVGVTFAGNSDVPTVSSRSLEDNDLFSIVRTADTSGTRMFVNSLSRDRYPINYVYGFSSDGFSYFLTTQLRGVGSDTYYSKLVRVCHDDENYYSYTEIPMSCMGEGGGNYGYNLVQAAFVGKAGSILAEELGITAQDDVLFASFSQSETINNNTPSNISALCVYSLKAIRRKFMQNIKTCFSGIGSRGLDFISPSHACIGTKLQSISEDFCGLDLNTPLGGEQPVEAVPVAIFSQRLTAVAATATGDYTVVFAGTAQGHLKKIVVESATSAFEYGDIVVDEGSAVNKDLYFDTQSMHLYVMTERKVSKVKVQECSVYKSCLTCLGAKDPYCGWCSLSNKCSLRSDCQEAAKDPFYWISYRSGRCTTITQVTPNQLQRTTARTLDLVIENLPTLNGEFVCEFTALDRTLITNAIRLSYGFNCTTPPTGTLPSIPTDQHYFTAKLSVRTTQGPDFVATNFTFFDCNTYSSCTQCVSSSFPCDWCVDGHRCTHDTAENCRNDILVTGVSSIGPSYRPGPGFCPTINSTSDGTNEILVPCGVKKAIKVKVHIIGQFIVQTRFLCQFNIEGRVTQVNAQLLADTIYCDTVEFTYTSRAPNITASFAVIWGGSKHLDNPDNIHILIYRCNDMADNCSMCLALPEKFGCGWCQGSDRCEVQEQCGVTGVWLNPTQICPNPN